MKILIVLCSLFVFCTTAHAQDSPSSETAKRDGNFGLVFSFDGLILSGLGGGIGAKYWLSDQWATVGSVDFGYSHSESGPSTSRNYQIAFSAGVERHLLQSWFSPYIGGTAGYSYFNLRSESSQSTAYNQLHRHIVYGSFNLGVELWVTDDLSLAGQYGFALDFLRDKSSYYGGSSPTIDRTIDRNQINLGETSVVVSAYF